MRSAKAEPHGIAQALAEGAGGRLDAAGRVVFGVARRGAAELTEIADLVQGDLLVAGQVEQGIEQHGAVAGGQNEAVAVRPIGAGRIELQEAPEQNGRRVRHAHRHARMPRLGLLDGVGGQEPDGIGEVAVAGLVVVARLRRGELSSFHWMYPYMYPWK